jgi:hypothetical protein
MKKQTKNKRRPRSLKAHSYETTDDFSDRIAVMMRGRPNELDAKQSPNRAHPCVVRKTKTYGKNAWDKPSKEDEPSGVQILNARGTMPLWTFKKNIGKGVKEEMTVSPTGGIGGEFRITMKDADGDTAVIWMSFKAFRALNHWGMPIAQKQNHDH